MSPQLIQDCIKGDRRAQFKLYKACYSVLMGICMRYKRDEDEAKAVLNVGFLKILKNLSKYGQKGSFEAWIKRIMINTIIDEFRKNRKVKELIAYTDFSEQEFSTDWIDFNEADKQFDAEELEAIIKQLPPVSQKVFNLFAIDGYSHKEIAKMLNISVGTSKWHLSFARKKLQEWLKQNMQLSRKVK